MLGNFKVGGTAERPKFRSHIGSAVLSSAGTTVATAILFPLATSVTGGRKVLLAIIILDIPLQIGAHLYWSEELGASGALGGLEISVTTVAMLSLYFLWFVGYISRRELEQKISLRPALPLTLYLMFAVVSLLAARNPVLGLYEVVLTAQLLLLFVYLTNWLQTRRDVAFVMRVLLIGFILEAGIIIALKINGYDVEIPGLPGHTLLAGTTEGGGEFSRPSGTLASPNVAGSYLSIMLTLAIGLLLFTRSRSWCKTVALVSVGIGTVALLFTYSREGWLALFCSMLLLCCAGWRLLRVRHRLLIVGVPTALLVSLMFDTPLSQRLLEGDEGAASSRIVLNKLAITVIEDHPVIGVGANNFTLNLREYATSEVMGEWLYAVHNKYLLIWAEAGLGALLAYLWFLFASLRRGWQCWKDKDPLYSPLALALVCGICALMICNMFQADRGRALMQLLIVFAALVRTIEPWTRSAFNGRTISPIRVATIAQRQFA
jgi:O-antigen ligase